MKILNNSSSNLVEPSPTYQLPSQVRRNAILPSSSRGANSLQKPSLHLEGFYSSQNGWFQDSSVSRIC